jgi:hypothetical protein
LLVEPPSEPPGASRAGPDTLFSTDLERLGEQAAQAAERSSHPEPDYDPERAYLEAVALDDQELPRRPKARGTVPDEYKYRFFLQPGAEPGALEPGAPQPAAPARKPPPSSAPPGSPGTGTLATAPPSASPAYGGVDLDALARSVAEEPPGVEGIGLTEGDEVDALLRAHGLAAEPAAPEVPEVSMFHADPLRAAEPSPQRARAGRASPWPGRLLAVGVLALAAAVLALAFLVGYRLG